MLNDLKILNGNLELEFNQYTYEYTVKITEDITSLEFSYVLEEDSYINIRNNNINSDESIVYVDVYNLDNYLTYTFYVYKENSELVNGIDNFISSLETTNPKEISLYKVQILSVSLFLIIIILFSVIFKRKHT